MPFYIWHHTFIQHLGMMLGVVSSLFLLRSRFKKQSIIIFFLIILFYAYAGLYNDSSSSYTNSRLGQLRYFLCALFFLIDEKYWRVVYEKYTSFFSYTIILSLIIYFLVVWGHCSLPSVNIPPLVLDREWSYMKYPFCVVPDTLFNLRFCGYYDEPGVVGTICGVLLITNRWNLKKWKNCVLAVAGIFSFSFYFFLLTFIYFIVCVRGKKRLFFLLVVMISTLLLYENEDMNRMLFSRLEFEDGVLVGDNRTTDDYDKWYNSYKKTNKFLFGYGTGKSNQIDSATVSYKSLITDYGIIAFSIFCMSISSIILLKHGKSRNTLICLLCFFSIMYQRPYIFSILYIFLIMGNIYNITENHCAINDSDLNNKKILT